MTDICKVGQNYTVYVRYFWQGKSPNVCTVFLAGKITKCTVIYGVYTRLWPALNIWLECGLSMARMQLD